MKGEKFEAVPVRTVKAYRGSGGIAPLVINIDIRWSGVVNFTFLPLPLGQNPGDH